jgi:phosphate starvation-inducible PhoH-like protein
MKNLLRFISTVFLFRVNNSIRPFSSMKNIKIINKIKTTMKKDTPDIKALSQYYKPKSSNQEQYVKYLNDYKTKILFAVGPAGTGKTMFACNTAIRELKSGNINKIVLTRPVVPVEEDIGFLPGNINKKMDPWTRPIFDIFLEFFSQKDIDLMVYNNIIEIAPLAYMRGRTFKKSFIIADEMQNSSPNQMLMLTTRIGDNSKMVITGDLNQSDKGQYSGLYDFIKKYKLYESVHQNKQNGSDVHQNIRIVELNNTDIERSPVVVNILDIYNIDKENTVKTVKKENVTKEEKKKSTKDTIEIKKLGSSFSSELFMSSPGFSDAALIPRSQMNMGNTSRQWKLIWEN